MKKVLVISYRYLSSLRLGWPKLHILGFTKYLPQYGWKPYIVAAKSANEGIKIKDEECTQEVYYTKDYLSPIVDNINLSQFKDTATVGKQGFGIKFLVARLLISLNITSRTFFLPDVYVGWIPSTLLMARRIIKKEGIDVIWISSPPYSSAITGVLLKKLTKKPLVIEFRDAWTLSPHAIYSTRIHRWIDNFLESFAFKNADHLTTVTPGMLRDYISKYPHLSSKISLLYNGFEQDDFPPEILEPFNKFTIVYTGGLGPASPPQLFLKAMKEIIDKNIIPKEDIQVLFVGKKAKFVETLIEEYALGDIVHYKDFVPPREANQFLLRGHLLLFPLRYEEGKPFFKHVLSRKISNYLASGRPILALVPPQGDAEEFILKYSDNSYVIGSQDVSEVVDAIVDCYEKWRRGLIKQEIGEKTKRFREEFSEENMTKELAEVFRNCLSD